MSAVSAPKVTTTLERRRRWERCFRRRLRITDAYVIVLICGLSAGTQVLAGFEAFSALRNACLIAVLWNLLLAGTRSRESGVFGSGTAEYLRVAHASGLAFGLFVVAGIFLEWDGLRTALSVTLPAGCLALLIGRWLWRRWLQHQRLAGQYTSRTLVVGNADDVEYVIRSLHVSGENGLHVIATTLFDRDTQVLEIAEHRFAVLGDVDSVAAVASEVGADTIIVASRPSRSTGFVKRLSWQLEGTASELVLSNRVTDVVGPRISFRPIDGLPLLNIKIPSYEGGRHLFKRGLDICVAALALVPIALATVFFALLIKLDSPGPVFFSQERVGRDGRSFRMFKFRSMHTTAERDLAALKENDEGSGPMFKMRDDPRVTTVGRVLRRFSLDELPQFWNVLIGDMSVVGPRPPLPHEVTAYDGRVVRRLYVKPGITGPWQVSGRSDLSWDESVRLDLGYVENWSPMNDLQIMWRTARAMVRPDGAY
ncbi:MAG: sugar transferase [Leucobacter sp.]